MSLPRWSCAQTAAPYQKCFWPLGGGNEAISAWKLLNSCSHPHFSIHRHLSGTRNKPHCLMLLHQRSHDSFTVGEKNRFYLPVISSFLISVHVLNALSSVSAPSWQLTWQRLPSSCQILPPSDASSSTWRTAFYNLSAGMFEASVLLGGSKVAQGQRKQLPLS